MPAAPSPPPPAVPPPFSSSPKTLFAWLRVPLRDGFLLSMLGMLLLSSLWPALGASGGHLRLEHLTSAGIALIFFLNGLGLSTQQMKAGFVHWRLHCIVQGYTFVVFPLLWLVLKFGLGAWLPTSMLLGFLYLCALPSTVSSAVAMTSAAHGNVAAAIFNASLSSLLGIFLTPLLVGLAAHTIGNTLPWEDAVWNLMRLVLLPLVLGQLAQPWIGAAFVRHKRYLGKIDRTVILLLVLHAFSDSVIQGTWSRFGWERITATLLLAGALLALMLFATRKTAQKLGFSVEDEIVVVFCGSKKTLIAGVPMAALLFGPQAELGAILLPIMFYHQLQLLVCAMLANRYAQRAQQALPDRGTPDGAR